MDDRFSKSAYTLSDPFYFPHTNPLDRPDHVGLCWVYPVNVKYITVELQGLRPTLSDRTLRNAAANPYQDDRIVSVTPTARYAFLTHWLTKRLRQPCLL